ncbi:hypothetical protein B9Z55_002246 [Caenorhabditis nigoni]|uniref:Uncharacterized protein n=1 Tax=Caenorhabditis nigoni TaxID=1611254 RepID=A0A2G5VJK8_9PELO|nr:hypothetical protein B9Z55_002246 [Caenorhabditis nigoni]
MSSFTIGPFPCRNPSSFSKYPIKKDVEKKSSDKMPIVHRNVEGENDGECYKIKGPRTPFILRHLEKHYMEKVPEEEQREKKYKQESTSGTKRERSESDSDEDFDDPNVPSTSSSSKKKKRLEQ